MSTHRHIDPRPQSAVQVELLDWSTLNSAQRAAVRQLSISDEHESFAGPIGRALAACEGGPHEDLCGVAIEAGGEIVGFLLMKRRSASPAWAPPDAAVVSGLRLDARHQGRGIGAAALRRLPAWVRAHWPDATRVMLTVDDHNPAGIAAYLKAGFVDEGVREPGRIGIVRRMTLQLG